MTEIFNPWKMIHETYPKQSDLGNFSMSQIKHLMLKSYEAGQPALQPAPIDISELTQDVVVETNCSFKQARKSLDYLASRGLITQKVVGHDPLLVEVLNFIQKARTLKVITGGGDVVDNAIVGAELRNEAGKLWDKLDAVKWGTSAYHELTQQGEVK